MSNEKYNGWANYETWAVNLWLTNEEGTYRYWKANVDSTWEDEGEGEEREAARDDAIDELAARLEEEHEDGLPELAGPYSDLLRYALNRVEWREIAEAFIDG